MQTSVLKCEGLSRRYEGGGLGILALNGVTFTVGSGEFIVVLGPSGSGKSTLLNLLGGMDKPTEGRLWYGDLELTGLSPDMLSAYRRKVVGFIFQFFNLIPSLTAKENIELASSIVKDSLPVAEALALVGLPDRATHFPSQLSGGEQQRVSIARAIVKKPGLLLADEPTGALDSVNSVAIVKLLLDMRTRLGCPVIAITHNPGMAQVADRIFYMKDGCIERIENNPHPLPVDQMTW
ncbi:MAG: ABC transporter ATP-binding protein [Firmicutes bacterium]|nr:ABC transporter ATP-binding protein [Bacillota bacterium]